MTAPPPSPRRGIAAASEEAATVLFLSVCGMAIGLAIDCGAVAPDTLASLCLAAGPSLAAGLAAHVALMPATHGLMLVAAMLAAAMAGASSDRPPAARSPLALLAGCLPGAAAAGVMLAGMAVGGSVVPSFLAQLGIGSPFARLAGAMVLGMTAGMLVAGAAAGLARNARAGIVRPAMRPAGLVKDR
jgi:hypothetical protein